MKAHDSSRTRKALAIVAIVAFVWTVPAPAAAYVGPGAGLSLLGAVWGMIVAIGTAIGFVVAWPVRRLLRQRRERRGDAPTRAREA